MPRKAKRISRSRPPRRPRATAHERALLALRRAGPQSLNALLSGVRRRRGDPIKALLYAHHTIEVAVHLALRGPVTDEEKRCDLAFHTAEIVADVIAYLVDLEPALRGRRLAKNRLLGLAENAVWHWPGYHVPELEKLLAAT